MQRQQIRRRAGESQTAREDEVAAKVPARCTDLLRLKVHQTWEDARGEVVVDDVLRTA